MADESGICEVCDYGPVPVAWGMYPDVEPEQEIAVCAVCRDGGLVPLHGTASAGVGRALGRLVNALVDGEGPSRRVVVEALLRGEGTPSGDWDQW